MPNAITGAADCLSSSTEPVALSPANGSNQMFIYAYLDWSSCSNASYYSNNSSPSALPKYHGNTSNNSYQLPQLNYSTEYYWKVVAKKVQI